MFLRIFEMLNGHITDKNILNTSKFEINLT